MKLSIWNLTDFFKDRIAILISIQILMSAFFMSLRYNMFKKKKITLKIFSL